LSAELSDVFLSDEKALNFVFFYIPFTMISDCPVQPNKRCIKAVSVIVQSHFTGAKAAKIAV
jgi:hypothetical protein